MFKKLLFAILFLTLTFLSTSLIRAQEEAVSESSQQILQEFCDRRSGGVINLETWYAGECDPDSDTSTFSGAKLGFGDIIILHVYELLAGEGSKDRDEIIDELFNLFKSLGDSGKPVSYLALLEALGSKQPKISGNSGIVPGIGYLVGITLSNPPVSSTDYIASVRSNMAKHSLIKPAYAQGNVTGAGGGYGFANFEGFLPMWRAFRNISYFFFVLAFVAYGFAIMFRVKLGQAAVTIQQALPKLIVTLLIITFSYAIVGLLIDLMWVLYYLVLNTLASFNVFGAGINPTTNILARAVDGDLGLIIAALFQSVIGFFFALPAAISAILGIPLLATYVIAAGVGFFTGGTVFLILAIVFLIAILIAFAKLLIKLITAYVSIIGNLVLAPLILLPDAIPGQGGAFGKWINSLIANIVVFPVASILLLFSGFFMLQPAIEAINSNLGSLGNVEVIGGSMATIVPLSTNTPPRVPLLNPNFPGLGGESSASNWMALIGLALLLMSPKFVDMVKGAFNVKPLQSGIGDTLFLPMIGGGIEKGVSGQVSESATAAYRAGRTQFDTWRRSGQSQAPLPGVQQWRQSGAGTTRRSGGNP